jgi:hypothetical protein
VDENGNIKAGDVEGSAVVTAKIGSITVECTITIKHKWTGYY